VLTATALTPAARPPRRWRTVGKGPSIVRAHTGSLSLTCRPPTLIDPLGRPVPQPMLVASIAATRRPNQSLPLDAPL